MTTSSRAWIACPGSIDRLALLQAPRRVLAAGRGSGFGELGFTAIECLVVLAVAAILWGTAVPAMVRWIDSTVIDQKVASLRSALRLAREEAMRRGEVVSVCARRPGDEETRCATGANDWTDGWVVFVDRGDRGVREDDNTVIAIYQASAAEARVLASLSHVVFQPSGISLNAASNFKFYGRADAVSEPTRVACVSKTGRLRVAPGTTCS